MQDLSVLGLVLMHLIHIISADGINAKYPGTSVSGLGTFLDYLFPLELVVWYLDSGALAE